MEVDLEIDFLQTEQVHLGPGLVSTPAIIRSSLMVAAEINLSVVLQIKNTF